MDDYLEPIAKIGVYGALIVLMGAHVTRWLLHALSDSRPESVAASRRVASWAVAAGGLLAVMMVVRLIAHSIATFGWADGLTWDNLVLIGLRSRWSRSWRVQFLLVLLNLIAARWTLRAASRQARSRLLLATLASFALAAVFPLLGHAAGSFGRISLDALHLIAAGTWVGALAVLVLLRPPPAMFAQFSPLAMIAVSVAVATGLSLAWLYVGSLANLWTPYGRLLLAKLVLVGGTALCGLINWRGVREGRAPSVAWIEVLLALGVVIVTAFLTETEHPMNLVIE